MSSTRKLVTQGQRFPGSLRPIAAAIMALSSVGAAQATTYSDTWIGASGGYWDVASNWSPYVPAYFDTVSTGSANTIYRTGSVEIYKLTGTGDLNVQGGTLRIGGASSSIGSLTMSGGTFSQQIQTTFTTGSLNFGSGTLGEDGRIGTVAVTGMTTFDPAGSITVGTNLNLNGGATWAAASAGAITLFGGNRNFVDSTYSGTMTIAAGTTFADLGNLAAGQSRSLGVTLGGTVYNRGTYTRSGLGTTQVQAALNNAGIVNVDGGTLNVQGNAYGAGTWNVASGATLQLALSSALSGPINNNGALISGGTLNLSAYSGNGSIAVTGGTFTTSAAIATLTPGSVSIDTGTASFGNTVSTGTLSLTNAGVLTGAGGVSTGTLNFVRGTMGGTGTTTVIGAATLDGTSGQSVAASRTLNLKGTTTWTPTGGSNGIIGILGGSRIVVGSGATFNDQGGVQGGATRQLGGGGSTGLFVNQGTYNRTGSGTTQVNGGFSNNGVLNLTGGAINVAGASSSSGQWNVGMGTTLTFSSGASDVHGGTLNNNGGTIAVTGGSLAVSGGGTSTGAFTVASGKSLNFGGGTYAFNGGSFSSDGIVSLASGSAVNFGGGTHAINSGSLSNAGTLNVSAGSLSVGSSVNFSGAGTVNVTGGQFSSVAAANLAGGTINVSGGTANFATGGSIGSLSISGGTAASQYVGSTAALAVGTLNFTGGSMIDSQAIGLHTRVTGAATFGAGTETLTSGHQLDLNGATTWAAGNGSTIAVVGGNNGVQAQLNIGAGASFADLGGGNRSLGNDLFSYVYNGGTYTRTGSGTTTAANSFTNGGTLNIDGGTMAFASGAGGGSHSSTGTINIASGATMQDSGNVNVGAGTIGNQGALQINGGTTTLAAGVSYGGNGSINVNGGALVSSITNAITTGGIALTGGAASFAGAVNASSLALSGGTLTATGNVTVATDYTNSGFGSGNGFDKRAGVSGTGLINGTNVAQAITGDNVTNGTTGNATLTIGNVRVGTTNSYAYQVANTGTGSTLRGAIQTTGLGIGVSDARLSGSGVTAANFGALAAGANSGDLSVAFTASTAGAIVLSGVNTIHVANDFGNVAEQNLAIVAGGEAAAYNVAHGSASASLGNVRVGTALSGSITVTNTATAGAYSEDLTASLGATTGSASGTGSVNGLVAGASNSSALVASLDSTTAGAKSGSVTVAYVSAGKVAGVSNGLGTLAVGSQVVAVGGGVYDTAVGSIAPTPIVIANQRVGGSNASALVVSNTASTGGYSEALNANVAGVTGGATAVGSVSDLAAGAANGNALRVGVDTTTAGLKSGTVTIGYQSDGTGPNGNSGLAAIAAGSQAIAVSGAVYRVASPTVSSASITAVGRVGGTASTTTIGIANTSPDAYIEALDVTRGATAAGFTSTGGISGLVAGGTSNAIGVRLDTTTAGTFHGSQVLDYVSTGAGTTGAADLAIGSGSVTLNGKVYATAIASMANAAIDFGIVHVGDAVTRGVSVTNAAVGALTDVLVGSASSASAPFSASGNLGSGLVAGQGSNALTVGLNTSTSGVYAGSAAFSLASHDADQSDAALADLAIGLTGTVNAYASDAFVFGDGAGTLTRVGSTFFLDFGTVMQGSGVRSATLFAANDAAGQADLLDGAFQFLDAPDFGEGALAGFADLAAGRSGGPLLFAFDALAVGNYMDTIVLHGVGHNAGGYSAAIGDLQLVVRGAVIGAAIDPNAVPEPEAWMLVGLGLPLLLRRRTRKAQARKT